MNWRNRAALFRNWRPMRIFDFLFPPRADEAVLRETTSDRFLSLLAPRIIPYTDPATVALLPFHAPEVRAAIHEAKYHGSSRAFELLAFVLAEYLRDADDVGPRRTLCMVPVPLGPKRQRARGGNQVEAVARYAARALPIAVETAVLERTRETESQVSLPRAARQENMRGAFCAAHPIDPSSTYIVIDDVLTTGATLQSAIDALKRAGAAHIIPVALAH